MVPFFLPIAQPSKSPKEALPEQSVDAAHGRQKADRDRRPCPGFLQTYKPSPKSIEFPSIQLQQVLPLFSPTLNSGTCFFHLWALSPIKGSCSNLDNTASWPHFQANMAHQRQLYSVLAKVCEGWHGPFVLRQAQIWQILSNWEIHRNMGLLTLLLDFFVKIIRKIQNASECLTLTYWRTLEFLRTLCNDMRQETYSTENYQ